MVDIALDARWGRISEGNGEDPYLSGVMGAAMTQGYQGVDMRTEEILRANRIMACLKHFALYGGVESGKEYNTVDMSRVRMMNHTCYSQQMDDDRCLEKAMGIQRFRGYRLRFYRRDSAARNGKRHPGGFRTGTEGGYRYGHVFQCLRKASG